MIKLILGDCLEHMKTLANCVIDLTVTSPPYDDIRNYNDTLNDWTENKWKSILTELFRITKPGGVVVWVVNDATVKGSETGTSFRQALFAMSCGFNLHDTMIYKTNKPPQTLNRFEPCFEFMFVFSKGAPKTWNPQKESTIAPGAKNSGGMRKFQDGKIVERTFNSVTGTTKIRENIWYLPRSPHSDGKARHAHPATFPLELARLHILAWTNAGDVVLDTFMGSGTTGIAAIELGRNFIGMERESSFFQLSTERVREAELAAL